MKSDVKFTPKWKLFKDSPGVIFVGDGDEQTERARVKPLWVKGKSLAEMTNEAEETATLIVQAVSENAQLKSERDELLEALEESYQLLQDISVNGRSQIIAKLGRIIAKARGAK